jgi:hypothetical protein
MIRENEVGPEGQEAGGKVGIKLGKKVRQGFHLILVDSRDNDDPEFPKFLRCLPGQNARIPEHRLHPRSRKRPVGLVGKGLEVIGNGGRPPENPLETLGSHETVGVKVDFGLGCKLSRRRDNLFHIRKVDSRLPPGEKDPISPNRPAHVGVQLAKGLSGEGGRIPPADDRSGATGVIGVLRDSPVLAEETLEVTAGGEDREALRRGGVEPRGSHLRKTHPANPSLSQKAVDPTAVLAQLAAGKLFKGVITERDHGDLVFLGRRPASRKSNYRS